MKGTSEVRAARRFYAEEQRKVAGLRAVLPLSHACHFGWFTQTMGSDGRTLDVFEHQLFPGRCLELGRDGGVYVNRGGDLLPADGETGHVFLRGLLPTREQWLHVGGYWPGGFLSDEPLPS